MRNGVAALTAIAIVMTACSGGDAGDEPVAAPGTDPAAADTDAPDGSDATSGDTTGDTPVDPTATDAPATDAPTTVATTVEVTPEDELAALLARPPVSAEFEVAPDGAAAATIGPAGGTLEATGPDGTTYTLDIPAEALLASADIVLTPLSSVVVPAIDGAELIGLVAEPDGLAFVQPATLTITGDAVDDDWVGWGALGDGAELSLAPTVRDGASRTMPITHFSAWGLATAELTLLIEEHGLPRLGQVTGTALEVLVAEPSDNTMNLFLASLSAWIANIESNVADTTGLTELEKVTVDVTSLLAALQVAGSLSFDPDVIAEISRRVADLFDQWIEAVLRFVPVARTRCSQGMDVAFQLARWRVIVGGLTESSSLVGGSRAEEAITLLDAAVGACAAVVVTWKPTVTVSDDAGSIVTKATARSAPVELGDVAFTDAGFVLSGRASGQPFVVDEFTTSFSFCDPAITPGEATMGARVTAEVPGFGSIADASVAAATVIAADDVPITMSCGGQEFGFEFFSSEYEILNIEAGRVDPQGDGYGRFPAEPTGAIGGVLARATFTDTGTRGSTATVVQEVVIEHVGI